MREVDDILVEPYCGSCGTARQERHEIIKEGATMYAHHPSAPIMQVSIALLLPPLHSYTRLSQVHHSDVACTD